MRGLSARKPWLIGTAVCAAIASACGPARQMGPRDGGVGDDGSLAIPDVVHTADGGLGTRADVVIAALTSGDAEFLWERPGLAAGKYARMSGDPFAFFRGSLALFLRDWNDPAQGLAATRFGAGGARPLGLGDPHPENFGTMRTQAGIFRLEPNDFDTADRLPYLWDVRRFAVGMCLAARVANPTDENARAATAAAARSIARAAIVSYADTIRALAAGGARPAIESGGGNPVLDDLFDRSVKDWDNHAELDALTDTDPVRHFIRGTPDPLDPISVTRDLPARVAREISASLAGYRASLLSAPGVRELVPLDAVQQLGQGIGSFPRTRALVLTRGASTDDKDDVLLEIKELPPQGGLPLPEPTAFASPGERLLAALAAGWTERAADPRWGVGSWAGFPAQIRTEAAGFKTVRVARLAGPLGTPEAIEGLGGILARLIARMHAAPVGGASPAGPIAAAIAADPSGFADEQTDAAMAYCDRVTSDFALFTQALTLLGPTLGVDGDAARATSANLRVLFDPASDPRSAGVDPVTGPLTINEICATGGEFVEVINATSTTRSIAGLALADADVDGGPRFDQAARVVAGATLGGGGRIVVAGGFSTPATGPQTMCVPGVPRCYQAAWDISGARGETIYLLDADDVIVDQAAYPIDAAPAGQSWGRLPDGSGTFAVGTASAGMPNVGP